jgi:pyruvate ferredoxin oxidoreductase delta subunit
MTWNKTGSWRNMKPVRDEEKCIQCGLCKIFCPDFSIDKDSIDYDYCKGCGICAEECTKDAIEMVKE